MTDAADQTVQENMAKRGHPRDNFQNIADMWSVYLYSKYGIRQALAAQDVGHMMILLKLAREVYDHDPDNLHDIKGYALCVEMINDPPAKAIEWNEEKGA